MAKIEKFEDIKAWQKARALVKKIYVISETGNLKRDFALREQMRRSAISVVSNIAEGYARRTDKEFVQFLYISHGSVAELGAQLYLALDLEYIQKQEFNSLYEECNEISKMIMGLIKYLRTHKLKHSSTQQLPNSQTHELPNS